MTLHPLPPSGTVHLHLLPLPQTLNDLARLRAHLVPDELTRADRLKSTQAADRCVTSRGLLREILGGYLGISPDSVRLATLERGKPCLLPDQDLLQFNLSHAGPFFLLAVASDCAVGIDLEMIDPEKPLEQMARMIFSQAEMVQWKQLELSRRVAAFYRCWVCKEACLKGSGEGFSRSAREVEFSERDWQGITTVSCGQRRWQLLEIAAPPGYYAALAVECRQDGQPPPQLVWIDRWGVGE